MPRLTAPKAGTRVTHTMMMLLCTKVTRLLWLLFDTVLGDVTLLVTSETLHDILLTLLIWLTVLKISGGSFPLGGLLPLFLCLIIFFLMIARITSVHNSFQLSLLFLRLSIFLNLDVLDLRVYSTLDMHFADILDSLLALDFVRKEGSFFWYSIRILLLSCLNHE